MKKKLLAAVVGILTLATIGILQFDVFARPIDNSPDCDKYAVVYCGTFNKGNLVSAYDNGRRNSPDIKKIYNSMGLYGGHLKDGNYKDGVVYQDGRVVVDGKTVATGAQTAIRNMSGGRKIAGTNAAIYPASRMGSAQTAMVMFDKDGRFKFAVMKPCGNPVTAKPTKPPTPPKPQPKPAAECKVLNVKKLSDTRYQFNAEATLKNGARVTGYTYTVTRDGRTVHTQRTNSASHTYNQTTPGNYNVKVTIHTTAGDKSGSKCEGKFTVPEPKKPGVEVIKKVNGKDHTIVAQNVEYNYQLTVKNAGNVELKDVKVTDTPEQGVTLIRGNKGTVRNNTWTYTIPSLGVGKSETFILQAKVPEYKAGKIKNTVCVDTPTVPGNPDDCDDATVETPEPGKVSVCDPETGTIIEVREDHANQYEPVDSPKCEKIEVCVIETREIKTINRSELDQTIHSTNLSDCDEVVPPAPTETPKTPVVPTELPKTGVADTIMKLVGMASLIGATAYYVASRRIA